MENGRTRPSMTMLQIIREYKDTPGQPELQHLGVFRQNNNNNNNNNIDDNNNKKKKINKT